MRYLLRSTAIAALLSGLPAEAGQGWLFDEKVDPLTDEQVATAMSSHEMGLAQRSVVVRCRGTRLEVFFGFDEFLDNDPVPVRYRVDGEPLVEERWFPSAEGTAVSAHHKTNMARLLMKGTTFIIEATDFRGQPHRASFDLSESRKVLERVLQQCGVSETGLAGQVQGLRPEIASELERWGPRNIATNKSVLMALGAYDGAQDSVIEPTFALAVQRFYDDHIQQCRDNRLSGTTCTMLHLSSKSGTTPRMPPISSVIYERAPDDLKKEAGKLRMGD